jgi:hypothetical protein
MVVTQQYVAPLSHRHQPLIYRRDTEKKGTRSKGRTFSNSQGGSRPGSRGECLVGGERRIYAESLNAL